jgi:hypothetical protein
VNYKHHRAVLGYGDHRVRIMLGKSSCYVILNPIAIVISEKIVPVGAFIECNCVAVVF